MRELDHPNLVSIYDFYQDDPKHFYMVLELMSGGELFDRIVQKVTWLDSQVGGFSRLQALSQAWLGG